jgi:hypothetical protein
LVIGGSHGRARYQTGGMNGAAGLGLSPRSLCVGRTGRGRLTQPMWQVVA